jgi:carbon starvation protein
MDTGVRLQRYVIQEWGQIYRLPVLTRPLPATLLAVGSCIVLAFAAGGSGAGGLIIWPLFGTTNQLLAGLTLLVISVLLLKLGRPVVYTLVPMAFVLTMAALALLIQLGGFWTSGDYFLAAMDALILVAAILVALEALGALRRARDQPAPAEAG